MIGLLARQWARAVAVFLVSWVAVYGLVVVVAGLAGRG